MTDCPGMSFQHSGRCCSDRSPADDFSTPGPCRTGHRGGSLAVHPRRRSRTPRSKKDMDDMSGCRTAQAGRLVPPRSMRVDLTTEVLDGTGRGVVTAGTGESRLPGLAQLGGQEVGGPPRRRAARPGQGQVRDPPSRRVQRVEAAGGGDEHVPHPPGAARRVPRRRRPARRAHGCVRRSAAARPAGTARAARHREAPRPPPSPRSGGPRTSRGSGGDDWSGAGAPRGWAVRRRPSCATSPERAARWRCRAGVPQCARCQPRGSSGGSSRGGWARAVIRRTRPGTGTGRQATENLATYSSKGSMPTSARSSSMRSGSSQGHGTGAPSFTPAI